MNYKTIKTANEAPVPIEIVKRDNSIYAVVLGDLRIESDYGIRVLLAQPHEEVSRHKVTATIDSFGTKVLHFDTKYDAESEVAKLEEAGATVVRADIKVLIDSRGNVVGDASPATSDTGSDVPF